MRSVKLLGIMPNSVCCGNITNDDLLNFWGLCQFPCAMEILQMQIYRTFGDYAYFMFLGNIVWIMKLENFSDKYYFHIFHFTM